VGFVVFHGETRKADKVLREFLLNPLLHFAEEREFGACVEMRAGPTLSGGEGNSKPSRFATSAQPFGKRGRKALGK
jgi:hypothetical protein